MENNFGDSGMSQAVNYAIDYQIAEEKRAAFAAAGFDLMAAKAEIEPLLGGRAYTLSPLFYSGKYKLSDSAIVLLGAHDSENVKDDLPPEKAVTYALTNITDGVAPAAPFEPLLKRGRERVQRWKTSNP